MFAGFDFGTSNCAMGVMDEHTQQVRLLSINQGKAYLPSSLYSLQRELICENVALQMQNQTLLAEYKELRKHQLLQAQRVRRQEDIYQDEETTFVGSDAVEQYLEFPDEGYYVKSVKSFLGASGLREEAVRFFEDIVTAMMLNIKQRAEQNLQQDIQHTVIGRPVNFQGLDEAQANTQALNILTTAAKRAGFKSIEFLYEPVAAGYDFESGLEEDCTVLVVDIGGGTTDCAMLRMGPSHREAIDRSADMLAHTGERTGGNDFDIQLAAKAFMPLFGMNSPLKNGKPMPKQTFWNAVQTNNVGAQAIFNSQETRFILDQHVLDTTEPELFRRFIKMREEKQNHHIVRSAEQGKIALSDTELYQADLSYIEAGLGKEISRQLLAEAVAQPIERIIKLMLEAINQAGEKPDYVYLTGGSSRLHQVRAAIKAQLPDMKIVDGDSLGSVAKGLTIRAQRLFG